MTSRQLALGVIGAGIGAAVAVRSWREARGMDFSDKVVAITGGSRGLGLVIARELAAEGARLALIARDEQELERARQDVAARGARVITISCDVRDQRQAEEAIARTIRELGGLDVLMNDAGIIQVGPYEHMTVADFNDAMATHFYGPLYTALAALPHMRRKANGRIVNISSIGGKIAVPHLLPYCASKFALTGLSEGLRIELAKDGIAVTTVCPGLMRTGSTYNASFKGRHRQEFAWFHVSGSIPGISISARRAARQVIAACRRGDPELIITWSARLAVFMNGALPNLLARFMSVGNRWLPAPSKEAGTAFHSGWQSVSDVAPNRLTRLGDRATAENNESPVGIRA